MATIRKGRQLRFQNPLTLIVITRCHSAAFLEFLMLVTPHEKVEVFATGEKSECQSLCFKIPFRGARRHPAALIQQVCFYQTKGIKRHHVGWDLTKICPFCHGVSGVFVFINYGSIFSERFSGRVASCPPLLDEAVQLEERC